MTPNSNTAVIQKRPQAVLFDYDGVLVASEPIHLSAWMQLLDELSLPKDKETILSLTGKTAPEIIGVLLNKYRPEKPYSLEELRTLAQRKNEFYIASALKNLQVYPGVREGLQWLRDEEVLTAVVSNARKTELLKTLDYLELTHYFDEIISRDDARASKPNPTPYLMAATSLSTLQADCVAIEDSPPGLEAALRAKIPAIAVTTSFPKSALETPVVGLPRLKPAWICPSIQDVFDKLKKLEKQPLELE